MSEATPATIAPARPVAARLAAAVALLAAAAAIVLAVVVVTSNFPHVLFVLACAVVAAAAAWYGARHRGVLRLAALALAAALVAAACVLVALGGKLLENALILAALLISPAAAKAAFAVRAQLPRAPRPRNPVLLLNPRSGGGKGTRFAVAEEARSRGIEAIELHPGDDLEALARNALADGADALAMAGGDGSQAVVAAVAAEHGIPFACIPAGTRNHFALDLGVDRDDVVGALDAFVDGGERRVDLAEINGRVFVNNVSLGLYAEAVQRSGYRDAKLRTILDTVPDVFGSSGHSSDLRWSGPGGEIERTAGALILVSNNPYRLGRAVGSGTRPRIDGGVLGIAAATGRGGESHRPHGPLRTWSAPSFTVTCGGPVPAGIDGEAVVLEPPLVFGVRPGALRVRIAAAHPGASPSAAEPEGPAATVRALVRIAAGRPAGETGAPRDGNGRRAPAAQIRPGGGADPPGKTPAAPVAGLAAQSQTSRSEDHPPEGTHGTQ